jgi:hypothetical protein
MIKYLLNPTRMYFILIIITCCHFAFYAHEMPINYYDEVLYFFFGKIKPFVEWSPLYSAHYSLLTYFIEDSLFLYRTNHFLIASVLFPSAIFILSLNLFSSAPVAFLSAVFFYLTNINLMLGPYVHVFNFSVTLLFFFLFNNVFPNKVHLLIFFLFGLGFHLRTENIIMSSCYAVFLSIYTLKRRNLKAGIVTFVFSVLLTLSGFFSLSWNGVRPIVNDGQRTIRAFEDHYVWRNAEITSDVPKFREKFGKASTIGNFIVHYPKYFLNHMLNNLTILPERVIESFHSTWYYSLFGIAILIYLSLILPKNFRPDLNIVLLLISFAIQSLAISLILQPVELYLIPFLVTLFFLCIYSSNKFLPDIKLLNGSRNSLVGVLILSGLGLLLFSHSRFNFSSTNDYKVLKTLRNMEFREKDFVVFHNLMPLLTNVKDIKTLIFIDTESDVTDDFSVNDLFHKIGISVICDSPYYDFPNYTKILDVRPILTNPEQFQFKLMNGSNSEVQCFRRENN